MSFLTISRKGLPRVIAGLALLFASSDIARAQYGSSGPPPPLSVGSLAPRFFLAGMAGPDFFLRDWCGPDQELRIAARRDEKKVVVLSTFATWCAPCRQELPCLQAFADSMADAPVVWRLINPAERTDSVKAFLAQLDVALPVLFDRYGRVYPRLGNGFPAVIVIDREGVIRYLHEGYGAGVIDEIRDSVEAALPDATTRAGLSNPTAVRASAQPTRER